MNAPHSWTTGDAYTLPTGWAWADIVTTREHHGIGSRYAPIARAGGAVAWGAFLPCDVARVTPTDDRGW